MAVKILLKRGSAQSWKTQNPILDEGEIGYEKPSYDTESGNYYLKSGGLKIGDGERHWLDLPYLNKFIITKPSKDKFDYPEVNEDGKSIKIINADCLYRADDTQKLYVYDTSINDYVEIPTVSDANDTNDIIILNSLPDISNAETNKLYIIQNTMYVFDGNDYINLNPELKEHIIEVENNSELFSHKETGKLFYLKDNETYYYFNGYDWIKLFTQNDANFLEADIFSLNSSIKEINTYVKEEISGISSKVDTLDTTVNAEVSGLNTRVNNLYNETSAIKGRVSTLETSTSEGISGLKTRVDTLDGKIDTGVKSLNTEIGNLSKRTDVLEGKTKDLETSIKDNTQALNTRIDTLNTTTNNEINNLNIRVDNLINETGFLKGETSILKNSTNSLNNEIDELKSETSVLNNKIDTFNSKANEKIDTLDTKITTKIDILNSEVNNLNTETEVLETEVNNLKDTMGSLNTRINDEIDDLNTELTTLNNRVNDKTNTLNNEVNNLKTETNSLSNRVNILNNETNTRIDNLDTKINNLDIRVNGKIDDLRIQISDNINTLDTKVNTLNKSTKEQIETLNTETSVLKGKTNILNTEVKTLDAEIDTLNEKIKKLTTNIQNLSNENNNSNIENTKKIEELSIKVNEAKNECTSLTQDFITLSNNLNQLSIRLDEQKPSIIVVDIKPEIGEENQLYKESNSQLLWHWNTNKGWETVNYNSDILTEVYDLKAQLQEALADVEEIDQKIKDFQNSAFAQEDRINQKIQAFESTLEAKTSEINSQIEEINSSFTTEVENMNTSFDIKIAEVNSSFSELTTTNNQAIAKIRADFEKLENRTLESIDDIIVRDTLEKFPEVGEDNKLYKALDTQKIYYWDSNTYIYELLKAEAIDIPVVKGGIEVIPETENLPSKGESDILYKTLSNEKVYTWNESTSKYVELGSGGISGESIVVVETLEDLTNLKGESNILYRVLKNQKFYAWNATTEMFEPMASGGGSEEEGFKITFVSYNANPIFAITKSDRAVLKYGYSSVDENGIKDGVGIGTLYINGIKKATIAINQSNDNVFDITNYLSLGENSVTLAVTNTQGKEKILSYSIEYADLAISCETDTMQIQRGSTDLSFKIMGSGEKKIHIQIDDKEPIIDSLHATQQIYPYTIPAQEYGDHIVKIHLERTINGIQIKSNVIKLGIISVGDEMVDTAVLSIFEQTESQQGEVITIPYQVYNPVQQTSDVILTIFDENGEEYSSHQRNVGRKLTYWTIQNFPAGNVTFQIKAKSNSGIDVIKNFPMTIAPSEFDLEIIKTNLELEFSAEGRSNDEKEPNIWSYGDYKATFENFTWSDSDGWVQSEDGETVLRFLAGNKMTIPFQPFATDRINTGYTIELEFASRDVADYDAVLISCLDQRDAEDTEGIPEIEEGTENEEEDEKLEIRKMGFEIKSSMVTFNSTYKTSTIQYKEDERVRVTIIFEPKSLQSYLIYIFVNGVLSDVIQYPKSDIFKQKIPANIEIGSDKSGLDLYKLRFYNRAFSFTEQLNNFICDRPTNAERISAKRRNDIYDAAGNITENSLPPEIPYLVIKSDKLPEIKDDKYTNRSCYFVDKLNPERSFTATGVQLSIQGTSSAGYPIKNFKVKFNEGITLPDGEHADGYPILEGHLPSKCLCLKADFASSEQANNVILVEYYDKLIRKYFKTPPQEKDSRIRTGIAGRPIVVFWHNTNTDEVIFWGQYNMNNDKSNENVFGFDNSIEGQEKLECWELSNNISNRCLFIESEYETETWSASENRFIPNWMSDFEARYPDLKVPYDNYTNLKRLTDWIASTCQSTATNTAFDEPITFHELDKNKEEIYYNEDSAKYRLAKFKNEFDNYFFKEPILFYYLFTETFLLVDSRAKNMFLTTFDGNKWFPIPYDMDTAIGINNEGAFVFEYDLEDDEMLGSKKVFNGKDSALWINVRDAFQADLFEMYKTLRSDTQNPFSYEAINDLMNKHQEECWPEAIWNADAKKKYIDVYLDGAGNYLDMCKGNKKTQREWWLYNAFKYRDSKYQTADAQTFSVYYRAYAPSSMTITPYQHLYARVDYTDSYPRSVRTKRNIPTLIPYPQEGAGNSEFYIRSADRLSSFGDMSYFLPDHVDFTKATKLQEVILGSDREGYVNDMLVQEIFLGNNRLLKYLNIENCVNFDQPLDISSCVNLEVFKAFGSKVNEISFPVGGHLKEIYLPATVRELRIEKQHMIEHFEMKSYANIQSLWIDDTPGLPIEKILLDSIKSDSLDRIRLTNVTWRVSDEETLSFIFEAIKKKDGIDVDNQPLEKKPIITGYIEIDEIDDKLLESINDVFPELIFIVNGKTRFFIRYINDNGTLLYRQPITQGENAVDPIKFYGLEVPTKDGGEDKKFTFSNWSDLPQNIQYPTTITAMYDTQYRVQFLDGDDKVVDTQWIIKGEEAIDPVETDKISLPTKTSTAEFNYIFAKWDSHFDNITAPKSIKAVFSEFLRSYNVYFYNGDILLQTSEIEYGACPEYEGTKDIKKIINGVPSEYYEFSHWSPSLTEPIKGETYYYAQFSFFGYIEDDWRTIISNVASDDIDLYGYAGRKKQTITYSWNNVEHTDEIEFEIIDKNHDILEYVDPNYNNGSITAGLTFKGLLPIARQMNIGSKSYQGSKPTLNTGGWKESDLRKWLNTVILEALPIDLQIGLRSVEKIGDNGKNGNNTLHTTYDKIFIPSLEELNIQDSSRTTALGQGTPYVLFTDDTSRKMKYRYWTRSTFTSEHGWNIIPAIDDTEYYGSAARAGGASDDVYIMFCFCI